MRCTGKGTIDYELSNHLKRCNLKARPTNRGWQVCFNLGMGENATMKTRDGGAFSHEEANITMVSWLHGCKIWERCNWCG